MEYYLDVNGSDYNDGKINSPIRSLDKVKSLVNAGDIVYLKRGCIWRGALPIKSGVSFYSYGDIRDNKPTIMMSDSRNRKTDWIKTTIANVWSTSIEVDVGNIVFNKKDVGVKVWKIEDVKKQGYFFYDIKSKLVMLYSFENPANVYSDIQCCKTVIIAEIKNVDGVVIDGLRLCNTGNHAIQIFNAKNVKIRNNEICMIGGGKPSWATYDFRLGNGVEVYNSAENVIVERNKIWDCYDAGVTTQSNDKSIVRNVVFSNNVILKCSYNFEYWHNNKETVLDGIKFISNTSLHAGYEWSNLQRMNEGGYDIAYFTVNCPNSLMIRNNIFFNSRNDSVHIYYTDVALDKMWMAVDMDYNMYWRDDVAGKQQTIIYWKAKEWYFTGNFSRWQNAVQGKDKNGFAARPNFVKLDGYVDLHLVKGSVGTNVNSKCVDVDFDGYVRNSDGKGYDLGAFEQLA